MDSRRDFLKKAAAGAIAIQVPNIWTSRKAEAQEAPKPGPHALVVVFLRGGCDGLNVLVPYRDKDYYGVRPTIAIKPPGHRYLAEGESPCIPITKQFGLHPSFDALVPLWKAGELAPIINVGSTHPTRSHFDAQDFMEWAAPGVKSIQEGWLNRYLTATQKSSDHFLRAFSPQPLLPRALRGEYSVLAAPGPGSSEALRKFGPLYDPPKKQGIQAGPDSEEKQSGEAPHPSNRPQSETELTGRLEKAGAATIEKLLDLNKRLKASKEAKKKYPRSRFSRQLADIAAVIKSGAPLEIAGVDYNGWDHHSYQGGPQGQQANMLRDLSTGIAAFFEDLGPELKSRVTLLTMTEFGRTVAENGSQGSDHGHGGFMLAVGGKVSGKKVHGRWTGLGTRRLYMGRDLPVHTDFRDVFDNALTSLFQFDSEQHTFFPGYERSERKAVEVFTA